MTFVSFKVDDPTRLPTPIAPLLNKFTQCAFQIAPAKGRDLLKIVREKEISISVWADKHRWLIQSQGYRRIIEIGLPTLERIWAYNYAFWRVYGIFETSETSDRVVEQLTDAKNREIFELYVWAHLAEIEEKTDGWPKHLPSPRDPKGKSEIVKNVNNFFLYCMSWILLHETAHFVLNHHFAESTQDDESIQKEYEADDWACSWIFSDEGNTIKNKERFLRIIMSISFALSLASVFEVYDDTPIDKTHPNVIDRVIHFTEKFVECTDLSSKEKNLPMLVASTKIMSDVILTDKEIIDTTNSKDMKDVLYKLKAYLK